MSTLLLAATVAPTETREKRTMTRLEQIWSGRVHAGSVRRFLLEEYLAPSATFEAVARCAERVEVERGPVRYLGSIFLPHDEVCFHLFEAPSVAALTAASDRCRLAYERVVETIWIPRA
jgi:hypothetical protein